jgi:hypothetical protein
MAQCAECALYVGTNDGPPPHDHAFEIAIAFARDEGASDGKAAASWYFDGNTDTATYANVLRGIEDGDPAVTDTFPAPDLSGQWADGRTGPFLVKDAADAAHAATGHYPHTDEWFADICDAYETAFSEAVETEIARMARYQTK